MTLIALYTVFFGCWALENYRKCGFNLSVFLIMLYCLGSICCLCIAGFYPEYIKFPERITFGSVASHILLLWLFMYPLIKYGNTFDLDDFDIDVSRLDAFAWCVAIPAVLSMIASSFDVAQIFLYSDFLAARKAFLAGDISNIYMDKYGAFGYVLSLGPQLSWIATFLFYYYYFYLDRRDLLTWLLLASTLSIAVNNLAIAGRDGFVRWIFFMLAGFILMRRYIDFRAHRKTFIIIGLVLTAVLVGFTAITLDRFEKSQYGAFFSLLRYGGEQFFLYSYGYERFFDAGYDTVASLFPSITREEVDMYFLNKRVKADFFLNTFPTFVGTFVRRVGFFNTVALAVGAFIFFFLSFWKRGPLSRITLTRAVAYLFYYEFMLLGFFYYMHGGRFTQYTIMFYLLLAFCFSHFTFRSNRYRV
ncbi:MAG: hypothetical protein K2K26_03735 [Muribaculaceae bacterium]|nr:hypothetical protein [Muribaculaceae bacterium]